jgi:hypothetical protein
MTTDDEADASEQDYGDDEEEDDHVSLGSDVDNPEELTDEDEEMDEAGEKRKLIVKLPVKTPTPERKTAIKRRLSQENDSRKPNALFPGTANTDNATGSTTAVSRANPTAVDTKENAAPASSSGTNFEEKPSKPMSVPPKSPAHQSQTAPLSPSLAFRGSPEKPPAFPPSIDVRFGGS